MRYTSTPEAMIAGDSWPSIYAGLSQAGFAITPKVLSKNQCLEIIEYFDEQARFRSTVDMQKHGFGKGLYKYFSYPLPQVIEQLRTETYQHLVKLATLGLSFQYPNQHEDFLRICHDQEQQRPTPLLLKYLAEDYNCLHQDLYGELSFPFQMAVLLSAPGIDFEGGEFVLVEQKPRAQSKVEVVPLTQGQAVIFAVNQRPVTGTRGTYRVTMRHGVSKLRSGSRYTLGIIFHDAK